MSFGINAQQANQNKRNDLVIFEEQCAIMRKIIQQSSLGACSITINDTTMTQSTATITINGTIADPVIIGTPTVIINGSTVTLGTTGTNLNSVIADINDANVSGVVASKNENNQLVLTYTAPAATTWQLVIGAGTANTDLGLTANTTTATNPSSVTYYQVSQGSTVDICSTEEMNEVISYFRNLGFEIEQQTNTTTGKTFQWVINY